MVYETDFCPYPYNTDEIELKLVMCFLAKYSPSEYGFKALEEIVKSFVIKKLRNDYRITITEFENHVDVRVAEIMREYVRMGGIPVLNEQDIKSGKDDG